MTVARKSSYRFGPFRLDGREQRLSGGGRVVPLTPKVFDVLRVLVENSGHLVEKDALLKEVWRDSFVEEGALNRTISVLRKALAEHDSAQQYIETIPKRGYRFVAPVADCGVEGEAPRLDEPPVRVLEHRARPLLIRSTVVLAAIAGVLLAGGWSLARLWRAGGEQGTQTLLSTVHRQVTFTGKEGAPTISPDGRRIAYVTNEKLEKRLVVQELAGGHPLEITGRYGISTGPPAATGYCSSAATSRGATPSSRFALMEATRRQSFPGAPRSHRCGGLRRATPSTISSG